MTHTPANDKSEAVAKACGYLNNHALPNVYALVSQLNDLVNYIEIIQRNGNPGFDVVNDPRVARAVQSVRALRPYIGGNL